ncbi:DUF1631 domain-containing protein [Stenotrophomonas sp. HITSZ_GD]|uniref:DUF1631 domain-containing protein n=1 Tax=Stenotrophomonas sp. HITSZ_GD TaxID=3037248 RepID=UPI00240D8E4A|nr:DUF1631 domain-containing protein [Stenotrophomonas sp. HITSZ_GD]MDG2526362.1 DUF1631 domain-containing protein [Stenotrophomonas sp. HITSZ_GD]
MTIHSLSEELPSRNPQLLEQVREAVLVPLAAAFMEVQDVLAEALFRQAERVSAGQNDYFEAIELLRRQRERVTAGFRGHLAKAWQALEAGRPLSVERTLAKGPQDLTLVPEHELDVRLAVRNLAGSLQHRWRPELMRLNRYLGFIAGGVRIDADNNPFGPEHLGTAVYAAFQGLTLAPRVHLAIIKVCEQQLGDRVGVLYAGLEKSLAEVTRLRDLPTARARRQAIPRDGAAEAVSAPDWIARFFSDWSGGRTSLAAATALDVHAREEHDVLPPALRQLLQRARGGEGHAPPRPLSPRELMSALSLMQTGPGAGFEAIDAGGQGLARGLRREILGTAAMLGIDPAHSGLDPADEDTLDLVGMLFDAILRESLLLPWQRALLGQLLVPFAKVALLDSRVFVRDTHPARRLLNLLADACDGNSGETGPEQALLAQVQAVVDEIARDFDEHLAVFLSLEAEFGASYEQYRRRLEIAERRATELQRAEERRERARGLARAAVSERLAGHEEMPPALEHFLSRAWHQHVQQAALRGDGAGPALDAALALGDAVLAQWRQARAAQPAPEEGWLAAERESLLQVFAQAGLAPPEAATACDGLRRSLELVRLAPSQTPVTVPLPVLAEPVEAESEALTPMLDDQAGAEFDRVTADFFRVLPVGTCLDFIDRQGVIQPGKLSWISPISGRLMFVNRRGGRLCVASPEELAMMVWLDRLRLHREGDAFYSAMQGVVDGLEQAPPRV